MTHEPNSTSPEITDDLDDDEEFQEQVAAALQAVLRAGRPERFKLLTVACPNDHVIGRVYRTTLGPVLVFMTEGDKGEPHEVTAHGVTFEMPAKQGPRAEHAAELLLDRTGDRVPFDMQCRCGSFRPREVELLDAIDTGRKRLSHTV